MLDVATVDEIARDVFPIAGGSMSLEYVEAVVDRPAWMRNATGDVVSLVIRLFVFEPASATAEREIRDIKEQQVGFADASESADRFRAYLSAWGAVLARAFENSKVEFDTLMPHDLVHADALDLKRAHSQADFEVAFSQRSRLGGMLPASTAPPAIDRPPSPGPPRTPPDTTVAPKRDDAL